MKAELAKMMPGYQVTDPNTGEVDTVISDKYIVCGNYCVRVKFPSGEDVYDCDFFINCVLKKSHIFIIGMAFWI